MLLRTLTESSVIFTSFLVNWVVYRKPLPPPSNIHKILVVKLDHLGDVLLATPAITNLRRYYKNAHITMLVGSWSKSIVEGNPHLDEILCYDAPFFCRAGRPTTLTTTLKTALQLLRQLKRERYDLVVELRGDFLTLVLGILKGGRHRLDRGAQRMMGKLKSLLSRGEFAQPEHEVDINLDVLKSGGIPVMPCEIFFDVSPENRIWAREFLKKRGIVETLPIIAIHPGSPVSLKRWPTARFAALADALTAQHAQILFLGGTAEKDIVRSIQTQMRSHAINLAGQTNLQQLGAVLQWCQLFIGNDSGPMHIAASVGTRVIGLFGPGSPQRFGPFGARCVAIRKADCPPCMKERCRHGGDGCMTDISVEDVLGVILEDSAWISIE